MYISKLEINNFRNFNKTEVNLKEGVNVILGPNNAGKTNLLKVIDFLRSRDKLKLSDFNYNDLFDNQIETYANIAPKIEISYAIEHSFNPDQVDGAIIKLKNFIVYEDDGHLLKQEDDTYKIRGSFKLVYELNEKFTSEYKSRMSVIKESSLEERFKEFELILEDFIEKYEWSYCNANGEPTLTSSDIKDIFNIDFIPADRTTDKLLPETKKFIKQKIDEQDTIKSELKRNLTDILNEKLHPIKEEIKTKFAEEQKEIGITKGHNILEPSFKYNAELDGHFQFHLIDEDKKYNLPLENNGLGYNNLIQIYNIIKFKIYDDYNILLIEEPEAHLHPAMQYQLFKYLQKLEAQSEEKIKNQIIITTHSPNISASSNIDDIITLHYYRGDNCCVVAENLKDKFISSTPDEQLILDGDKKHLKKFLDITRSDMLFTERVILVEGLAEKLLVPMFAEKEQIDLINNHIAIVEVGGINFNHFLPLFKNTKNKILCVRDCDFNYKDDNGNLNVSTYCAHNAGLKLISERYISDIETIKAVTQKNGGSSFENELFLDNMSSNDTEPDSDTVCKKMLKLVSPDALTGNDLIKKLDLTYWHTNIDFIKVKSTKEKVLGILSPYKTLYDKETDSEKKNRVSNLFFANLFLEYASSQKGNLALAIWMSDWKNEIKTPEYIKEGLEWIK